VINFINAALDKNFPLDSELTYNWTENVKDNLDRTIADSIITIAQLEKIHFEVMIGSDNTIVLRVFDYGYQYALKTSDASANRITLTFPQPKIIYLEHNSATPDEIVLELVFQGQGKFEYRVPTMKLLTYSIKEIDQRHMVILLPLYLLKLRREIEISRKKGAVREKAAELKALLNDGILKTLDANVAEGYITSEDAYVLVQLVSLLYDYLYAEIEEFDEEGVKDMLVEGLELPYETRMRKEVQERVQIEVQEAVQGIVQERVQEAVQENTKNILEETAKNLLKKGFLPEVIADATKLSLDRVMTLQVTG
jgi:hypothetical protein